VEPPHRLYVEESGNPNGIPVVYIHGGPGSGVEPKNRCFFDPDQYRIILYDQRGAGRSIPHAELQGNDTAALVDDLERIREFLRVERWMIFGGSWGSTLALVYAQTHPGRVRAMILRGISLCRPQDLSWLYQEGASRLFPDYWKDYLAPIPLAERDDCLKAYYRILTGSNELARMAAAKAWCLWEARIATLRPNHDIVEHLSEPHVALGMARIATHFFINQGFLEPGQILSRMDALRDIQGIIVHGRYDLICPIDNAFALRDAWPGSQLNIIRGAGHSVAEPAITDALVRATQSLARQLSA